ncbi:MAG: hypothetical protein KF799_04485 [Bdellovibrionales bacterium]|nr:hypothetical protein [Bdellovibrionales bacterium]
MRFILMMLVAAILLDIPAYAQELPIEAVMEEEAADVEVCQDFICTRLRQEILVEASKCRPLASFKRRRMRVKRTKAANSCKLFNDANYKQSKGKCSAAVRSACERAGVDAGYLQHNAYDLQKRGLMEKAGFVNMIWKYNEKSAPLGAVLIYVGGVGHRYGHVEVRVNPNLYCSDYCNSHPVSAQSVATSRGFKLVGVYLPFTSSIQITSTNEGKSGHN